ncbi:SLATT domain-containing protein [Phaeobacter gallaeciensis]|uniref:SLATT domain-containing protein n=1 Tax=Phaeobacter gallaeciensis TaxID=60890 RepID=UPI000BBCA909|nr:SLATT domain-containing protein [Phaeobacter gallaeciensis]ATF16990.1 hypothetical protein PhaeoP129_00322 [Phaeobacter gallaeciensis]ATF21099.1 hypothetical protein PhaeoP128_00322 [Phaeobacter gallaeciensis]
MTDKRVLELTKECKRQEESCAYTAAGLYIWQKRSRFWKSLFIVAPIILGGIATSQILTDLQHAWAPLIAASLALLAGFFPALYEALGMNLRVSEIGASAAEFTNLRDRFRQMATVHSHSDYEEFRSAFEQLMDRMDAARTSSKPLPEWCFKEARKKIEAGDYSFEVDEK